MLNDSVENPGGGGEFERSRDGATVPSTLGRSTRSRLSFQGPYDEVGGKQSNKEE